MSGTRKSSLWGKITILFVICCCCLSAQAKYGGGTGEPNDPYLICTAEQMNTIGDDANDWDKHFKLMTDIDLSSYTGDTFNIIGYFVDWDSPDNKPFTGVFNGNGHKISNFSYNSTAKSCIGLFVYVEGPDSEIKNLGLIEPNVHAGTGSVVGSLVGNLRDGTISNCYTIDGSITGYYIGGLAGVNYSGSLLNCYSTGDVSGDGGVGGLVAYNSGSVSNCYSIGDVSGDYEVGGLVGINAGGSISNCYSTASISGDNTLGGLVGYNHSGTITDSYSTGGVSGRIYIGGLLGYNYYGTILNCYSAGSVKGYQSLGGLVGCNIRGDIVNSFWDIETSGQKTSDGGTGLPTPEMQTMSTFTDAGWDFENVWWILEGIGYPRLLWEDKYGGGTGEPNDPYLIYTAEQMNTIGAFQRDWDKHFKLMADIDLSTLLPPPPPSIFKAGNPNPADGAFGVSTTADLSWTAGLGAKAHDVYFGTTSSPPFVCSQTFTTFDPGTMANGTKYYWRIDEFDGSVAITGDLWSFTTIIPPPPPPQLLSTPPPSTVDVDLSDYHKIAFNIIGSIDNPFTGVFDGNGHTISNFTYESNDRDFIGLFGCVSGENAEIKNLGLIDPNVDAGIGDHVGSLVGWLWDCAITNCYADGGSVVGYRGVGGLVGINGWCDRWGMCYSGMISNCYSTVCVSGYQAIGGLVGKSNSGKIYNCYSDSIVSGTTNVGGLLGINNEGTISNSYSNGDVSGNVQVGGLVGTNYWLSTVYNSYSSGNVSGDYEVGGLAGAGSGKVSCCFWDIETSGQTISAGGTGKTTSELQSASTFLSWGCDLVWTIDEGNDYPRLWWEKAPGEAINPELYLGCGSGEVNDPYLIYTAEQLNMIGLFQCIWDKHFLLCADIDLSSFTGTSFNIIGYWVSSDNYKPFTGVFDGNGHTISNFSYTSTDKSYIGIFGYVRGSDAIIKELRLIDPNVDAGTGHSVGSLVGSLRDGTIIACYAEEASVSGDKYVGGLVGNNGGTITDCYSTASVLGDYSVGSLIGYNSGTITNCFSTGSVNGTTNVGGLVGANSGTTNDCRSKCDVLGDKDVGGLVGYNIYGIITNCYVEGGSISGQYNIGGFVGCNARGTISNCYSTGSISGYAGVGGLVGHNYEGTVTSSFWDIDTSGQTWSAGGTGLPTDQMQMKITFTDAGWDFENIWWILEGTGYPRLWWEEKQVPMKMTPRTLNCRSEGNWLKAHLTLPQGFTVADVDSNRPAVLHSLGIESASLYVFVNDNGLVQIEATFERQAVCSLAGDWPDELTVTGFLTDGSIFLGTSTVRIIHPGMKVIEEFASCWLQGDCVYSEIDINRDSLVNLPDYALLMNIQVEFVTEE